ncbi:hypothetical protein LCGC14_1216750 [marine sediment metagenome]|uniref:Uncharacterized protein n=1 Tax=marine sediment metagenome TaxID=412755 RepID=A0A0F9LCH2_9ZZZZ
MLDLPAIKELCEAVLDGPWESQPHQELAAAGNFFTRWDIITQQKRLVVKGIYGSDDAEFIATARTLVPQLVEALDEAQGQMKQVQKAARDYRLIANTPASRKFADEIDRILKET